MRAAASPRRHPAAARRATLRACSHERNARSRDARATALDRLDDQVTRYGRADRDGGRRARGGLLRAVDAWSRAPSIARGRRPPGRPRGGRGEPRPRPRPGAAQGGRAPARARPGARRPRRSATRRSGWSAKALAAALDVFARPDIHGLARLQDRVDLLLDHVEQHPGLRAHGAAPARDRHGRRVRLGEPPPPAPGRRDPLSADGSAGGGLVHEPLGALAPSRPAAARRRGCARAPAPWPRR